MVGRWLQEIRRRLHPLHHLRRFGPAQWVLARIDRPWMTRINGVPHSVAVRLGRNLGTVLSRGMAEESAERNLLIAIASANGSRSFWDVGANYGLFTFALRAARPALRIEAFEPDPDSIVLMRRTLDSHGSDRVRLHPIALSNGEGTARFLRDTRSGATGALMLPNEPLRHETPQPREIDVETSTIDVESRKLGAPDIVKIDVEGAELEVLQGGKKVLHEHKPILLVECTRRQDDVRRILEDAGYEIRDTRSPTTSIAGPGMPFMALAIDPDIHKVTDGPSAHSLSV
jgi:FkbM family methyltransferase